MMFEVRFRLVRFSGIWTIPGILQSKLANKLFYGVFVLNPFSFFYQAVSLAVLLLTAKIQMAAL